jgi:Na+-translocating ferredoxin:NAD+ oxidoreductase RnfG subunit
MKRALTALIGAAAVATPVANAASIVAKKPKVKPKKRVVTVKRTVTGDEGFAGRWGSVEITLIVRKTTTIVGSRKTITRKVISLGVPIYPNHTDRSVFINQQALPILEQEALTAKYATAQLDWVSGATDTSQGFTQSLQSALLKAKQV